MRPQPAMIENIRLRVSASDKAMLITIAKRRGVTISEFMRATALKAAGTQ